MAQRPKTRIGSFHHAEWCGYKAQWTTMDLLITNIQKSISSCKEVRQQTPIATSLFMHRHQLLIANEHWSLAHLLKHLQSRRRHVRLQSNKQILVCHNRCSDVWSCATAWFGTAQCRPKRMSAPGLREAPAQAIADMFSAKYKEHERQQQGAIWQEHCTNHKKTGNVSQGVQHATQ